MKKLNSIADRALMLLVACLFASTAIAQNKKPDRLDGSVIVNTDLVVTWAQITARNDGRAINGLVVDDFVLHEEGKRQKISLLKEGQPLSVVILVDGMACVRPPEIEFRRSHEALRQLAEDTEIALMAWDSDVRLVQAFTRDQNVIAERIENRVSFFVALNGLKEGRPDWVRPERTNSRPGEAIYQAAQYLEKAASPNRRKIIIVISTSPLLMARTHQRSAGEVEHILKRTGATVYALLENTGTRNIYGSDVFNPVIWPQIARDKARRQYGGTLEQFVELTGGSILTSKNLAWKNLVTLQPNSEFGKEFDDLFIKLLSLIRLSYTIGYYPENTNFDGRFRRISLELSRDGKKKAGKVDIKARSGYYALRPLPMDTLETNSKRK